MSTKTLSVDEEAYRILSRARRTPRESFSQVIKRAQWDSGKPTCDGLLSRLRAGVPDAILDGLDAAQSQDLPPDDPWND